MTPAELTKQAARAAASTRWHLLASGESAACGTHVFVLLSTTKPAADVLPQFRCGSCVARHDWPPEVPAGS